MIDYLRQTFKKLKEDILASVIYEVGKYIVVAIGAYFILKLFPKDSSLGDFLSKTISVTVLQGVFIIFFFIVATIVIYFFFNRKRFALIKKDLQTDELTGVPNHRALTLDLSKTIAWAKSEDKPFSLILMDIDDFKKFNSDFSQTVADKVLVKFATLLRLDSRLTDSLYRQHVKGDEFIIITKDTILENAVKAANRKRETIASTGIQIEGYNEPFHLTVCCGVVEFDSRADDIQSILERGFTAMKQAKSKPNKNSTVSLV